MIKNGKLRLPVFFGVYRGLERKARSSLSHCAGRSTPNARRENPQTGNQTLLPRRCRRFPLRGEPREAREFPAGRLVPQITSGACLITAAWRLKQRGKCPHCSPLSGGGYCSLRHRVSGASASARCTRLARHQISSPFSNSAMNLFMRAHCGG